MCLDQDSFSKESKNLLQVGHSLTPRHSNFIFKNNIKITRKEVGVGMINNIFLFLLSYVCSQRIFNFLPVPTVWISFFFFFYFLFPVFLRFYWIYSFTFVFILSFFDFGFWKFVFDFFPFLLIVFFLSLFFSFFLFYFFFFFFVSLRFCHSFFLSLRLRFLQVVLICSFLFQSFFLFLFHSFFLWILVCIFILSIFLIFLFYSFFFLRFSLIFCIHFFFVCLFVVCLFLSSDCLSSFFFHQKTSSFLLSYSLILNSKRCFLSFSFLNFDVTFFLFLIFFQSKIVFPSSCFLF